jgi:hypothetical protein
MAYTVKPTTGPILSHVQAMYRPGERQLAIDLFKALGCAVYDTTAVGDGTETILSAHPDPSERSLDNVIFLTDMPQGQVQLEAILRQRMETDPALRAACDGYRGVAGERPAGLAHFAVRYPSLQDLERVLDTFEDRLTPELKPRASLKVFRPHDPGEGRTHHYQSFVYTDVVSAGLTPFGQIIELGAFG